MAEDKEINNTQETNLYDTSMFHIPEQEIESEKDCFENTNTQDNSEETSINQPEEQDILPENISEDTYNDSNEIYKK